jgi:hypothetical protein
VVGDRDGDPVVAVRGPDDDPRPGIGELRGVLQQLGQQMRRG